MKIAGLQKLTLIDYPDTIACSVFLAGCNLDCGFCHNRWMIDSKAAPEVISVGGFFSWLETRKHLLKGVCVSGGEPTINADLPEFLEHIHDLGLKTKLDTNGILPERLKRLLSDGLVDYVAMDIKAPLDERYDAVCGIARAAKRVAQSVQVLRDWSKAAYEYRTTVEPQLSAADLADIAAEIQPEELWYLQIFKPAEGVDGRLLQMVALNEDDLRDLVPDLSIKAPRVQLRAI